jgi:hypothetical protein
MLTPRRGKIAQAFSRSRASSAALSGELNNIRLLKWRISHLLQRPLPGTPSASALYQVPQTLSTFSQSF